MQAKDVEKPALNDSLKAFFFQKHYCALENFVDRHQISNLSNEKFKNQRVSFYWLFIPNSDYKLTILKDCWQSRNSLLCSKRKEINHPDKFFENVKIRPLNTINNVTNLF